MTEMQSAVEMLVFPGFHVSSSKIAFDLNTKQKTKTVLQRAAVSAAGKIFIHLYNAFIFNRAVIMSL